MAADVAVLDKRAREIISARSRHESVWRDCMLHSWPLRAQGFSGEDLDATSGQSRRADLLDSTSTDAGNSLVSALVGGMTPANQQWMSLEVDGLDGPAVRWLDESALAVWKNIHQANFDAVAPELMTDLVGVGWGALYVSEDSDVGGLTFEWWTANSFYATASKASGILDTFVREYELSAEQCISTFGENMVSDETRKLAVEKPDDKVKLRWMIYPRRDRKPGAALANNLPIASCTWEVKNKKLVRESGYHEQPVVAPRWSLLPNSMLGVGPIYDALPDIRQLNNLVFSENAAVDLAVSGMWIAEDDGVLNPRTVKVGPRKVIVANSVDSMKPLLTGADFNVTFTKKEQLQTAIRRTLMAEQLQPPSDMKMTATEWLGRVALLRQLLGPRFGRLQAEYLQPLVARAFGLALRAGVLGPLPDALRGKAATVKYKSPLARAQQLEEVSAIDRFEADLGASSAIKPAVLDLYDWDEAKRHKAALLGVPLKLLLDKGAVDETRDARVEAEKQAQQAAMQQQAATATIDASAQRMARA